MLLRELLDEAREILDDECEQGARDVFWSTSRLVNLFNEGQDVFCERTGYIQDSTSTQAARITTAPAQQIYPLHTSVILVRRVELAGKPLWPILYGSDHDEVDWNPEIDPDIASSLPIKWRTDKDTGQIEFEGTISSIYNFDLTVWRRALIRLNKNLLNAAPEIPARFHMALVEYACWKAQLKHDSEAFNAKSAGEHKAEFEAKIREGEHQFNRTHNRRATVDVGAGGWSWP